MERCELCGLAVAPEKLRQIDSGEKVCYDCLPPSSGKPQQTSSLPVSQVAHTTEPKHFLSEKPCWACKELINAKAVRCPHCQSEQKRQPNPNVLFALLSFLIPIIGIILGVVYLGRQHPRDRWTGGWCLLWPGIAFFIAFMLLMDM